MLNQFDLVRGEAGNRHGDTVLVFGALLYVVRRPIRPNALVEQIEEPVEADRRAIVGVKSKVLIATSSVKQHGYDTGAAGALAEPFGASTADDLGSEEETSRDSRKFFSQTKSKS